MLPFSPDGYSMWPWEMDTCSMYDKHQWWTVFIMTWGWYHRTEQIQTHTQNKQCGLVCNLFLQKGAWSLMWTGHNWHKLHNAPDNSYCRLNDVRYFSFVLHMHNSCIFHTYFIPISWNPMSVVWDYLMWPLHEHVTAILAGHVTGAQWSECVCKFKIWQILLWLHTD